jgi:uncharacterized damage-inducible protein DinB
MSEPAMRDALKRQFSDAFDVLSAAVGSFPADVWSEGGPPYRGPGRACLHALLCAEFYTCRDEGVWHRFGQPVWQMADADVPDQPTQASYLAEVRARTAEWIDRLDAEGLAAIDGEGRTALERIVYAIRHLQHHTGEVFAYQKQAGLDVAGWD